MANDPYRLQASEVALSPPLGAALSVQDALTGPRGLAGAAIVRKFPFNLATAGLAAGHTIYTPTAGDILLDCWVQVDVAFDGTTPFADIGTFVGANTGLFAFVGAPAPLGMNSADAVAPGFGELIGSAGPSGVGVNALVDVPIALEATGGGTPFPISAKAGLASLVGIGRVLPALLGADPIKVCVSQTGQAGGAAVGGSVGSGVVYLVTATPA